MKLYLFFLTLLALFSGKISAQQKPEFLKFEHDSWVDSLMNCMTMDQKIGQLFMIQAYSNGKNQPTDEVLKQIKQFGVGGIIFMQGDPTSQIQICNTFQEASAIPLLIAIDGETGLGFRLDSTISYPVQMAMGAIQDDTLIYKMGFEIGEQFRMMGIHMNMAPVCDINVDPENPVINYRSFGENRELVAHKSALYARGLQDAGVLATAKHFPGHGNTKTDSHSSMPVISQTKKGLDSLELYPFSYLINNGIGAIMTAHLQVPSLEPDIKLPSSLSLATINKTLKKELGFQGLVITDAMNMKGVSNAYSSAESSVKALQAGNDMLEIVPRLDRAIAAVKLAVENGELTEVEINSKCRKIFAVKKWLRLDVQKPIEIKNIKQKLNANTYQLTNRLLEEKALTVLINDQDFIPLKKIDTLKIASLAIGSDQVSAFQKMLGNYTNVDHFFIGKSPTEIEIKNLLNQLEPYNLIITGIHGLNLYPYKRFGLTDQQISLIEKLVAKKNTVFSFFGNPFALQYLPTIAQTKSLIVAYQDNEIVEELAAQLIFGSISANGKLPVTVSKQFPFNSGINVIQNGRLKYTLPEEVGISSKYLQTKIDSLAKLGIEKMAFPGCQLLIAKDRKIIYSKSYGWYTYDKVTPVKNEDLYDLASVTKITGSLPVIMKMYDEKMINLDAPFSNYFKEFKNTNKSAITLRDILTHQAQLQGGLPLWLEPGNASKLRQNAFQLFPSNKYQVRISSGMYERNDFENEVIKDIAKSPLRTKKEYHYSDLGFCLFSILTNRITGIPFDKFLETNFYKPLGAITTGFKPYERFPIQQIVPTEDDQYFRKELLEGYVHDETAALLGGVAGNAGLFSNANDLAKVIQMYLQMGYYGGKQYIKPETIKDFTKVQFPYSLNRRALGFDKPNPGISGLKNKFPAADASPTSYGHTGFTGIFTWADPDLQLLFIFLSNRVYPTRRNSEIYRLDIRNKMHQAIYDAIKKGLNEY